MRRMVASPGGSQAGLEVAEVRRHRRIVSIRYLLEKAAQSSRFSALSSLAARLSLLGRIYIPVNFADIINVYARKPAGHFESIGAGTGG
jgi:hypothetical protein